MSTRTNIRPATVVSAGDMSGNITSQATVLQSITGVGYAVSWAGTAPVGSLAVQVSNDYSLNSEGAVNNAGTWTTITLNVGGTPASSIAISGNTGNGFIDIDSTMAYAIRVVYTAGSGVGALTVIVTGKVA